MMFCLKFQQTKLGFLFFLFDGNHTVTGEIFINYSRFENLRKPSWLVNVGPPCNYISTTRNKKWRDGDEGFELVALVKTNQDELQHLSIQLSVCNEVGFSCLLPSATVKECLILPDV